MPDLIGECIDLLEHLVTAGLNCPSPENRGSYAANIWKEEA
jgi:hypothetical protein